MVLWFTILQPSDDNDYNYPRREKDKENDVVFLHVIDCFTPFTTDSIMLKANVHKKFLSLFSISRHFYCRTMVCFPLNTFLLKIMTMSEQEGWGTVLHLPLASVLLSLLVLDQGMRNTV